MKRVVVHIDWLVLNGFPRSERHGIAAGLQGELSRLLAAPTTAERLAGIGHVASVRAGKIQLSPGVKPQTTGANAARSISKGLIR